MVLICNFTLWITDDCVQLHFEAKGINQLKYPPRTEAAMNSLLATRNALAIMLTLTFFGIGFSSSHLHLGSLSEPHSLGTRNYEDHVVPAHHVQQVWWRCLLSILSRSHFPVNSLCEKRWCDCFSTTRKQLHTLSFTNLISIYNIDHIYCYREQPP